MSKIRFFAAASAVALIGAGTASAQQLEPYQDEASGFYLGGGYSYVDIETDSDDASFDDVGDGTSALTVRGGYQFTPVFSFEVDGTFGVSDGGFDLNSDEIDLREFDQIDDNADADDLGQVLAGDGEIGLDYLVGAYVRAGFPVNERFNVSGRVGYALAEVDNTFSVSRQLPDGSNQTLSTTRGGSDDGFAFGGSARFNLSEVSAIRADYTRYNFGEANADMFTLTYQHTFGGPGLGY